MTDASPAHQTGVLRRLRGFGSRHPEWWVVLAAAGAWVWMAAAAHPPAGLAAPGGHAGHGAHGGSVADAGHGVLWLGVMVVAMMLPLMLTSLRHVAGSRAGWRRHRAVAGFLAGYLAVWMLAMPGIAGAWRMAASLAGWTAAAVAVAAVAALWEVVPMKRHLPGRCERTVPLASRGWRADADCIRFGSVAGGGCVASCWALMAVCVAFGHSLAVMAALFGVQLAGRYGRRASPALVALAVLVVCLASLAARMAGWHLA